MLGHIQDPSKNVKAMPGSISILPSIPLPSTSKLFHASWVGCPMRLPVGKPQCCHKASIPLWENLPARTCRQKCQPYLCSWIATKALSAALGVFLYSCPTSSPSYFCFYLCKDSEGLSDNNKNKLYKACALGCHINL